MKLQSKALLNMLIAVKMIASSLKYDTKQLNAFIGEVTAGSILDDYEPAETNAPHIDGICTFDDKVVTVSVKCATSRHTNNNTNNYNQLTFTKNHEYDYAFCLIENIPYMIPQDVILQFAKSISVKKDRVILTNKFIKHIKPYQI